MSSGTEITAEAIASLVRSPTTTIEEAVSLIESYADVRSSGAVIEALHRQHARTMAILEGPLTRRPS